MAAVDNTRVLFPVFPRPVTQETYMKYSSASVASGEIQIVFLRRVLRGHSGKAEKSKPKIPDALDFGSDGALISASRGGWWVARGNAVGRRFSPFRVQRFPDSGHPDIRARGLLSGLFVRGTYFMQT